MLTERAAKWLLDHDVGLPRMLEFGIANRLMHKQYKTAKAEFGNELPDLPGLPPGREKYNARYIDLEFLVRYPWAEHFRLLPTIVSPPEALVFMPTYSPHGTVGPGHRNATSLEIFPNLMHRGWRRHYQSPWTYLDAIDSVFHVLSTGAHLVVADFRSSDAIRKVLLEHQAHIDAPNYELWFSDEPESPWVALNAVLLSKFRDGDFNYFIHTTSDLLWTQRGWLRECILEMNRDADCLITYPTVTTAAANVDYQAAELPVDKDPFEVSLANAYCRIFHRDFFAPFDYRYPDVFRNCYTESFIPFMLDALGKNQRIVPRANCAHCEGLDIWEAEDGTTYAAGLEQEQYLEVLEGCKQMRLQFPEPLAQIEHLKNALYMDPAYYSQLNIRRYRGGVEIEEPASSLRQTA